MATTKANSGENITDVASRVYGHATGVFWLLEDNGGLTITTEFSEPTELIIRKAKIELVEIGKAVFKIQNLHEYKLLPRQGFFDVTVENQGDIKEGSFPLLETNNYDGFTEHLFEADKLKVLTAATSPRVRDFLKPFMPIATITEEDKSDGIGWMIIERNFIVR